MQTSNATSRNPAVDESEAPPRARLKPELISSPGPVAVPGAKVRQGRRVWAEVLQIAMLTASAWLLTLHFVHLAADFPNFAPWMDWSKYTDEGWYGDAAIRYFQTGSWYVPGDFNPAVALPVWPLMEGMLFRFTGVSLVAARALTGFVFAGILLCAWLLIARAARSYRSLAAPVAVLLLAASPFCYVFTRLAILEPLLVLLMLMALVAAQSATPLTERAFRRAGGAGTRAGLWALVLRNFGVVLALGLLLPALVLTKTTGLFLVPAIAWMLFAAVGYRVREFLGLGLPAAVLGGAIWLGYFVFGVRPHYLLDYRYLFSANAYTGMTRSNWASAIFYTLHGVGWMGRLTSLSVLAASVVALGSVSRLRAHPLIVVLLLWAGGYGTFLAYHNNLQPRYYLVIAVPLTMLLPVVFSDLVLGRLRSLATVRTGFAVGAALLLAILLPDLRETVSIVRHPQYTLVSAAHRVSEYIAADRQRDPRHNPLILSISGSDLSLMTGLRSICDDFGTLELEDRVSQYHPGWYVAWNLIEDDKMDALTPRFHVERVASFPAMDDQDRNQLILYRLDEGENNDDGTPRRHRTGRRLRGRVGQQPSTSQLKH